MGEATVLINLEVSSDLQEGGEHRVSISLARWCSRNEHPRISEPQATELGFSLMSQAGDRPAVVPSMHFPPLGLGLTTRPPLSHATLRAGDTECSR